MVATQSLAALGVVLLLAGCATTRQQAERALLEGNYNDAIHLFQAKLAEHPDDLDARLGLGIALYRAGLLADAAIPLDEVLTRAPANGSALLYTGLIALQQGQDGVAEERLARFRDVARIPRFGAQFDRALALLRSGEPVGTETRRFVATSLEDAVRAAREVQDAWRHAERAWRSLPFPYTHCVPTRRGYVCS